jgi:hypothetical protein
VSGQGFFVLALNSSAQLIFNESAKSITQNTGLNLMMGKPADQVANNQYLRLQLAKDSIFTDDIMVSFKTNAKATFDINEDAPYKSGSSKVSLSSMSDDNIALAINKLPLSSKGVKLALKVGATADGNYKISLKDIAGVPQLYSVWLKDAFTKDSVNMRTQSSYSFDIALADTNTFGSKRFTLILLQDPAFAYHLLNFTAAKTDNKQQVEVIWNTANEQNYTHFSLERSTNSGKTFDVIGGMLSAGQGTYSLLDKNPEKGDNLYRLKQEDYNNTISYSNVVQIQYADKSNNLTGSGHLSVYPNPAVNIINLVIDPQKPVATYSIRVTNSVGTVVKQTVTSQPNWLGNVSNLLTGTYLIQVVNNKDNSLVGQTKFVKL